MKQVIVGVTVICGSLFAAAAASAYDLTPFAVTSSFDGTGSTAGVFGDDFRDVAVDEQSGTVYVLTSEKQGTIDRFTPSGTPAPFSAPSLAGATSLELQVPEGSTAQRIAVDNSSDGVPGRIYVLTNAGVLYAIESDGSPASGTKYPLTVGLGGDVAVDRSTGDVWIAAPATNASGPSSLTRYLPGGQRTATFLTIAGENDVDPHIDFGADGSIYVQTGDEILKYSGAGVLQYSIASSAVKEQAVAFAYDAASETLWEADPQHVTQYTTSGTRVAQYNSPVGGAARIAVDGHDSRVYVGSRNLSEYPGLNRVDILEAGSTTVIPSVTTGEASDFHPTSVTLHGSIDPSGTPTDDCHFEWSFNESYDQSTDCVEGAVLGGSGELPVSVTLTGLKKGVVYHYRLVGGNSNTATTGKVIGRQDKTVSPSDPPQIGGVQYEDDVSATGFVAHAGINPNGAVTTYRVEYGLEDCSLGGCVATPNFGTTDLSILSAARALFVGNLEPDTPYHYRFVATNQSGTAYGPDQTIRVFAAPAADEACANAHVRQQVSAAFLPDCRAYELVSAVSTGGYEVASRLVSGGAPLPGVPNAVDQALYGVEDGAVPGPWNPTNRGVDPYIATRGRTGWSTEYAGIPANFPGTEGPFSSTLDAAAPNLSALAFGGPEICDPCFPDGSSGLPIWKNTGETVQGMTGSTPEPAATPSGIVKKRFSADGSHAVFGTTSQLEPDANSNGTDTTLYARDLDTGATEVISTLPDGSTIQGGTDVAELDISADGSRTIVGQQVGAPDGAGNRRYHLYMHFAGKAESVDLMPGSTEGALYSGMTDDGSVVYLVSREALTTTEDQDTDTSADMFRITVDQSGATQPSRVSIDPAAAPGGVGDTDGCDPPTNVVNEFWNLVSGAGDCSVVAVGGGGGVAAGTGSVYFLSPEKLDMSGSVDPVENAPNLYAVPPTEDPQFVMTLESELTATLPVPTSHSLVGKFTNTAQLTRAHSMAVDQTTGDFYVMNTINPQGLRRYHADGTPSPYPGATGGDNNTNVLSPISGVSPTTGGTTQVAIDNSGTATDGNIYIANSAAPRVVKIFARDGSPLGQLTGGGTPNGTFETAGGGPTGVAVDPHGLVYVSAAFSKRVYRYDPGKTGNTDGLGHFFPTEADYDSMFIPELDDYAGPLGQFPSLPGTLAVDSDGTVYLHRCVVTCLAVEGLVKFESDVVFGNPVPQQGTLVDPLGIASYVDPLDDYLYVNTHQPLASRGEIREYDPAGALHSVFGKGQIGTKWNSLGVAVHGSADGTTTKIYVIDSQQGATGTKSIYPFNTALAPDPLMQSPLVIDSVNDAGSRFLADFQITRDGRYAVFGSTVPASSYENRGLSQVYRYDAVDGELSCASCSPTAARATGASTLSTDGLSVAENGKVFFDSDDVLDVRDLDERSDVYEWDGGVPQLISTGSSGFHSRLLSASSDGKDVFFFTRDALVPEDQNGSLVRLYDARENGGFAFFPEPPACKASDECHGSGSPAPNVPGVATIAGSGGNAARNGGRKCPKGKVRRRGKCVKKHRGRHHGKRGKARHGGGK